VDLTTKFQDNELHRVLDLAQDNIQVASILLSSKNFAQEQTPVFCAGGEVIIH
jgi:hypothetical protein